MSNVVPINNQVVVDVESPWWSKINWTQVVGFAAAAIAVVTSNKLQIAPELQGAIALFFTAVTGLVTIIMRTYFTNTITPHAITPQIVTDTRTKLAA